MRKKEIVNLKTEKLLLKNKTGRITKLWRDERFITILVQGIFILFLAVLFSLMLKNLQITWEKQGSSLSFHFLSQNTGFEAAQTIIPITRTSPIYMTLLAGLVNTIYVSILGIIFSTILGIIIGISYLSKNFIIKKLAWLYIEVFRNLPLLLIIVATYYILIFSLPKFETPIVWFNSIYISNRGVHFPSLIAGKSSNLYLIILLVLLVFLIWIGRKMAKKYEWDTFIVTLASLGIFIILAICIWHFFQSPPFLVSVPIRKGFSYIGGKEQTPEFFALLIGLVIGTAPFIADIVRSGIANVSKGQTEAANALGLSGYKTMRYVVFPQALRTIIPPLTSNYLSLTKNSTLAAGVAFTELFGITRILINHTGRAIEIMGLSMIVYMILSLLTAWFMNWYNKKIQLVER